MRRGLPLYVDLLDKVRSLPVPMPTKLPGATMASPTGFGMAAMRTWRPTYSKPTVPQKPPSNSWAITLAAFSSPTPTLLTTVFTPKSASPVWLISRPKPKSSTRNWRCSKAAPAIHKPGSSLKTFRLGFTTPARRIENSALAAGRPRPPNAKAKRYTVSLKHYLQEAPSRRRLRFTETHSKKRMPPHQKLLQEKKRTIQAKLLPTGRVVAFMPPPLPSKLWESPRQSRGISRMIK